MLLSEVDIMLNKHAIITPTAASAALALTCDTRLIACKL